MYYTLYIPFLLMIHKNVHISFQISSHHLIRFSQRGKMKEKYTPESY